MSLLHCQRSHHSLNCVHGIKECGKGVGELVWTRRSSCEFKDPGRTSGSHMGETLHHLLFIDSSSGDAGFFGIMDSSFSFFP